MSEEIEGKREPLPPLTDIVSKATQMFWSKRTHEEQNIDGKVIEVPYKTLNVADDVIDEFIEKGFSLYDLFEHFAKQTEITPFDLEDSAFASSYETFDDLLHAVISDILIYGMEKNDSNLYKEDVRRYDKEDMNDSN